MWTIFDAACWYALGYASMALLPSGRIRLKSSGQYRLLSHIYQFFFISGVRVLWFWVIL